MAHHRLLPFVLVCGVATAEDTSPRMLLARRMGGHDMRCGEKAKGSPPGRRCDLSLFNSEFACCWNYRTGASKYYEYQWCCDSEPDNEDCSQASAPETGALATQIYMDPYSCSRSVDVFTSYQLKVALTFKAGAPTTLKHNESESLQGGIQQAVSSTLNITVASVRILDGPTLKTTVGSITILDTKLRFQEDPSRTLDTNTRANTFAAMASENAFSDHLPILKDHLTRIIHSLATIQALSQAWLGVDVDVTIETRQERIVGDAIAVNACAKVSMSTGTAFLMFIALLHALRAART